jgi:hypothetical protein
VNIRICHAATVKVSSWLKIHISFDTWTADDGTTQEDIIVKSVIENPEIR